MTRHVLQHPFPSVLLRAVAGQHTPDMALIVPNVQAGRDLRSALRGAGMARTLTQVAREHLREAGWTALRPGEREAFFRDALDGVDFGYLAPIRDRPGTLAGLAALLGEFMRTNLEPGDVLGVATGPREMDVARAFGALTARCHARKVYDPAYAEYFAARLPVTSRRAVVHGFAYLDAGQLALLDALLAPGSVVTLPSSEVARGQRRTAETSAALRTLGFRPVPVDGHAERTGDQVVEGYLQRKGTSRGLRQEVHPDIESEVRACLRQVGAWLAAGAVPERLAVIVRHEPTYLGALSDVAREYQLPLISGAQQPLLETPLGGVVQAWVDAHARGWRYGAARRFLIHPLVAPGFDALARARALQPHCPPGLAAWHAELTWLELPAETTWHDGLGVLQRLIVKLGIRRRCVTDAALNVALTLLTDRLEGEARRHTPCAREELLGLVAHVLRSSTVPILLGKSGVRVANPLAALGRRFDHVWVLGLADTLFPRQVTDNALLDSAARARWRERGVTVPDASSLASVEEALFLGAVGGAAGEVVISRPRRDVDGRELRASPFWTRVGEAGGIPETLPPGSDREKALALTLIGEVPDAVRAAAALEAGRDVGEVGPYAGLLGTPVPVGARRWSPSQLHAAGACRFRWFAGRLLRLDEPLAPDADEDRRLTGTLLHAALEGALTDGGAEEDTPGRVRRAEAALYARERDLKRAGELRPGPLWEVQREEIRRAAARAVHSPDFMPAGWTPVALEEERSFTVQAGPHTFDMVGIVDRVDRTPDGLTVTDYKAGTYVSKVVRAGSMSLEIQLPLYMNALGAVNGRYFSIEGAANLKEGAGPGAEGPRRKYRWADHQEDVTTFLTDLGDHLEGGNVAPSPDGARQACTYCAMLPVCRYRGTSAEASGAEVGA